MAVLRSARFFAPVLTAVLASGAAANVPPQTPVISEPTADNMVLSAGDVHMTTDLFADADAGDTHVCSDWEIWTVDGGGGLQERVWAALCVTGVKRVHVQLGDGVFQGSYSGKQSLNGSAAYGLRVRFRDSSGDPATEWSAFAVRPFTTAALSTVLPMELTDIAATPAPTLTDTTGTPIVLAGGTPPATLRVETAAGGLLLELAGTGGPTNALTNPAMLDNRGPLRVTATAGGSPYTQPSANLTFTDDGGAGRSIYLPGLNLAPGGTASFWIAEGGGTYAASAGQAAPDFSTPARGAPTPWTVREPGFTVEVFATGFQLPVNIAFIPNAGPAPDAPYFYVTELYGAIKLVRRNGAVSTYASNLLNYSPTGEFPGAGEQGVTGVCVDPASGDVFASMLYDNAPPTGPHYPKVVRFHSNDGGVTAATQTTIRNMTGETQGQSHQVSNVSIGPDGKLYVHMGDGFNTGTAQNINAYRGKILRMNLDGSPVSDNPFYNSVDGVNAADYVFAYGVRNPFAGCWRLSDQSHYIAENGPSVDRITKLVRARNYLWSGSDASMTNYAIYNWAPACGPVNIAFIEQAVYSGSGFPSGMYGNAFVAESGETWGTGPQTIGKKISRFGIDATGASTTGPFTLVEYNGPGKATCAGLAAGPDGLYFTDLYKDTGYTSPTDAGANVLRVRYVGEASFTATPQSAGSAPVEVAFTDTSTVPGATAWAWSFGDGGASSLQNPTHTYTANGVFTVRLTVTGSSGPVVTQLNAAVRIGQPPRIAIIGASLPPSAADAAVADYLRSLGYDVTSLDDEPANRPSAPQLAEDYGLVMVSSTIASANVGGEFRTADVPVIFWENALLQSTREGLVSGGTTVAGQTQIAIIDNTHPIMQGLALGSATVYSSAQTLSLGTGTVAPGATVLATRVGDAAQPAVMVAESGAALLDGYTAPQRRVFLFFEDAGFLSATPATRSLLSNAVCWSMRLTPAITTPPAPASVAAGDDAVFSVQSTGSPLRSFQWRKGGADLSDGARISGAHTPTLTIADVQPDDQGDYTVVISAAPCGGVTSNPVSLSVTSACVADFNRSGTVSVQDIFDFLSAYFLGLPAADINGANGVTVQDIFDFLGAYFTGC